MGAKETNQRRLPSMTALLDSAARDERFAHRPRGDIKAVLTSSLAEARQAFRDDSTNIADIKVILDRAAARLSQQIRANLGRVINATGIVLHTGLGRAPLAQSAIEAVIAATGYCNLEFDMETGERGRRAAHCEDMLCRLTGAEAALVVNNNAAATMLVLAGLAGGREAIVSRGQLIEIGGSFRLPDVMAASGCTMVEVGTTNKTHIGDYEKAITPRSALLLHVHTSNYRVEGFAEAPSTPDLVQLARRHPSLLVYDDLGSGALLPSNSWDASGEPTVPASLVAGADVISFSGDKLLGGPQCGLILGRRPVIERLRNHPIARAVRVDKLTIAALQATLMLYADRNKAMEQIPTLRLLSQSMEILRARAEKLRDLLQAAMPGESFETTESQTFAGGGSLPAWSIPTVVVRWRPGVGMSAARLAAELRGATLPVISRIENENVILDMRTVGENEVSELVDSVRDCKCKFV